METDEMLAKVMPILGMAKAYLQKEGGFLRDHLALAEVTESKNGEDWTLTFFYNYPGQETYCEIDVSKKDTITLAFRRLPENHDDPSDFAGT